MSRTISPGLVDASHWTYMAAAMSDGIERAIAQSTISSGLFPKAVLRAARAFFDSVTDAFSPGVPVNPVASASNYSVAARALRASATPTPQTRAELNELLRSYASLIQGVNGERRLAAEESERLRALERFFTQIAEQGEVEAYEHYARRADD